MSKDEQYFSIEEVAKMLKVAYITVYRLVNSGKLKSFKAGKQHRITKVDIDEFLKNK